MKKNQLILGLVALAAIVAIVIWGRNRIHFNFGEFRTQLSMVNWPRIGIGVACIYVALPVSRSALGVFAAA